MLLLTSAFLQQRSANRRPIPLMDVKAYKIFCLPSAGTVEFRLAGPRALLLAKEGKHRKTAILTDVSVQHTQNVLKAVISHQGLHSTGGLV